jgi:hypothetical protein
MARHEVHAGKKLRIKKKKNFLTFFCSGIFPGAEGRK